MDSAKAAELVQQAMLQVLWLAGPILVVGLIVGVLIGIIQSITQIQDHTLSFAPKLIAILIVICLCLPLFFEKLSDYSQQAIQDAPKIVTGSEP